MTAYLLAEQCQGAMRCSGDGALGAAFFILAAILIFGRRK